MSFMEASEPDCKSCGGRVALRIDGRERDLGGFSVRRVLPSGQRRMVGPFIFFDHMGPAGFPPGKGIQVRPHPHIGIATVTYLFDGEIMHRDSLGVVQPIRAGAVNLMTAGRGIVHSERAGEDLDKQSSLHGIQSWFALPDGEEEIAPAFEHTSAADLPEIDLDGASVRLIIGEAWGRRSPVTTYSTTLYLDCHLDAGASLELPADWRELAIYVVEGRVAAAEESAGPGTMLVADDGGLTLRASEASRVMAIGGDPVGERHIWWNFVSSSKARIEQASEDWRDGRFAGVPGDDELMPLPEK